MTHSPAGRARLTSWIIPAFVLAAFAPLASAQVPVPEVGAAVDAPACASMIDCMTSMAQSMSQIYEHFESEPALAAWHAAASAKVVAASPENTSAAVNSALADLRKVEITPELKALLGRYAAVVTRFAAFRAEQFHTTNPSRAEMAAASRDGLIQDLANAGGSEPKRTSAFSIGNAIDTFTLALCQNVP